MCHLRAPMKSDSGSTPHDLNIPNGNGTTKISVACAVAAAHIADRSHRGRGSVHATPLPPQTRCIRLNLPSLQCGDVGRRAPPAAESHWCCRWTMRPQSGRRRQLSRRKRRRFPLRCAHGRRGRLPGPLARAHPTESLLCAPCADFAKKSNC